MKKITQKLKNEIAELLLLEAINHQRSCFLRKNSKVCALCVTFKRILDMKSVTVGKSGLEYNL